MSGTKHKVFTILLVEDDAGDVDMFLRTVEHELPRHEDEQVTLVINATAEGALERLQQQPIDLIIADVRLPGMSGIEQKPTVACLPFWRKSGFFGLSKSNNFFSLTRKMF